MHAPENLQVEAAKQVGRWEKHYYGSQEMEIPKDFLDALETRPNAKEFYETLNRRNLYAIYFRLHTAKRPETKTKCIDIIIAQLENRVPFH